MKAEAFWTGKIQVRRTTPNAVDNAVCHAFCLDLFERLNTRQGYSTALPTASGGIGARRLRRFAADVGEVHEHFESKRRREMKRHKHRAPIYRIGK